MNYEQSAKAQTERLMADGHATILAIESSCDETAAAIVRDGRQVISSVISSQIPLHAMYGGVVPEIASRAHVESVDPDRKSTRLNSSHTDSSRMPSSA